MKRLVEEVVSNAKTEEGMQPAKEESVKALLPAARPRWAACKRVLLVLLLYVGAPALFSAPLLGMAFAKLEQRKHQQAAAASVPEQEQPTPQLLPTLHPNATPTVSIASD